MTVRYIHRQTDRQIHAGFKYLFGASRTADELYIYKTFLQSWSKIVWTTAKIGAVTDTTSNVQPI